jgi:hypothetical protein
VLRSFPEFFPAEPSAQMKALETHEFNSRAWLVQA